jgi:hypothetical protein
MADAGRCGHCGFKKHLDSKGNMVDHTVTIPKHGGTKDVRCSGSGKPPLPKR